MEAETPTSITPGLLGPAELRALELVRRGKRFVLTGHVRPDGDCIGSQAALARVLGSLGKDVWIVNPDPAERRFEYLARDVKFGAYSGGALPEHDVAVLLDFSELARTGTMAEPLARAASKKLVVDHHLHHGEPWWDEAFVDTGAAATGLLVLRIARALGAEVDAVAARGVFTSLVADTGWFKYSNTDSETLAAAADMVALGADPSEIFAALYQRRSHLHPLGIGKLLARTEYFAGRRLAVVDQPLAEGIDAEAVDTDEVLDTLRSVGSVEVVLYLRELADGTCKLSARSKGDYDVNALARAFGGGGHRKASGATIAGRLDEVRPKLVAAAIAGFESSAHERSAAAGR